MLNRGSGALRSATLDSCRAPFLREWGKPQARWRTYRLAALHFGELTTRAALFVGVPDKDAAPSAVLPAGERILAGRYPAPPRLTTAKRERRRRPLPASYDASRERPRTGLADRNIVIARKKSRFSDFVIPDALQRDPE